MSKPKPRPVVSPLSGLLGVLILTTPLLAQPFRPGVAPPIAPEPAATESPRPPQSETRDSRPYFGLTADTVRRGRGAEVLDVDRGGPADRAGIRTGDVIERFNGQATPTVELLGAAIGRLKAGQTVSVEVRRAGLLIDLRVTPSTRPPGTLGPDTASPLLGVVAHAVDAFAAAQAGLPIREGAVVDEVLPGTPAAMARIPLGAIIVGLDQTAIKSPDQLRKVVAEKRPGDLIRLQYYDRRRLSTVELRLAAQQREPEQRLRPAPTPPTADRAATLEELRALRMELERIQRRIQQLEGELK